MERVINNELQPVVLEDGTILPAAGTPEAGPKEVELSETDRRRFVETSHISLLKPSAPQQSESIPAAAPPPAAPTSLKKEKS